MLAKRTAKNQITLPKALLDQLSPCEYFEVTVENRALVLRPVKIVLVEGEKAVRYYPRRSLSKIIGSGTGLFRTAAEVDEYLESERQSWDG
ncbi:MAG: AbrB/MazE/SpoVT family DNA-binding domain-containing protein [Chloroflexi bacterium]|nr:AbrB/MazE/SpoVT family DNA-binding domain-containing protein [Chloroflexota bacterium]